MKKPVKHTDSPLESQTKLSGYQSYIQHEHAPFSVCIIVKQTKPEETDFTLVRDRGAEKYKGVTIETGHADCKLLARSKDRNVLSKLYKLCAALKSKVENSAFKYYISLRADIHWQDQIRRMKDLGLRLEHIQAFTVGGVDKMPEVRALICQLREMDKIRQPPKPRR